MFKSRKKSLHLGPQNEAPFTDADGATESYFAAFIKPLADKFTMLLVVIALSAVCVSEGLALMSMMPLHAPKPYFLEVERDAAGDPTGRVTRSDRVASEFSATEANKRYFMKQWLTWTFSINPKLTTSTWLPKATSWTRGKATNQLDDWVTNKEKIADKMERNPTYTREIGSVSISFISKTAAIATVTLIERVDGVAKPRQLRKIVTLEHDLVPLKDEEQEYDNPIGLAITGFVVNDDQEK